MILIKKGQSVPVDGVILEGRSHLDYSSLNGEPLPKEMNVGDTVVSGTINMGQSLKVRVTKNVDDSTLSVIINKLEQILENKTGIERFSSKLVKYFIPTVLTLAVTSFIV